MERMIELIFIGDRFYVESGTMMSSIYHLNGQRSDWGMVNVALRKGITVQIRPATKEEIEPYERELAERKAKKRAHPMED